VSDANFSSITATDLTLTSSEFPLTIPNGQLNVRQINISRAMLMEGSDSFFGSPFNASNNIGGLPRSRINFWSSTELYTMGMRFGVTEENKAQINLDPYGNVSVFNININNVSTMDMDNASTTFHNTLNVENVSVGGSLSVTGSIEGYQETLIAGTNITITGNTISSAGSGGTLPANANFSSVNTSTLNTITLNASTIDTSGDVSIGGIISAPNQVRFKASRTASTTTNTNVTLPFNKTLENVGGGYSNTTYTFTAPITGTYYFYAQLFTSGDDKFRADFISGSTLVQRISREGPGSGSGGPTSFTGSFHYTLNQGQTMYMKRADGIVNLPVDPYCAFGGYLLG